MACLFVTIFFAFVTKCYSIDTDYYLPGDMDEDGNKDITSRRSYNNSLNDSLGQVEPSSVSKFSEIMLGQNKITYKDENEDNESYTNNITLYNKIQLTHKLNLFKSANGTGKAIEEPKRKINYHFNIYSEYEYIYESNITDYADNLQLGFEENTSTRLTDSTQAYLADFYNLKPAVGYVSTVVPHVSLLSSSNLWYVQEDLPCWELPYLYAELGSKASSEVFRIHDRTLKNVIEKSDETKITVRSVPTNVDLAKNKWCAEKPCFGDHILCLFKSQYSVICTPEYKVNVPEVSIRIALINTINSMRNRVANGQAKEYPQLPTASNMQQVIYDNDLQNMAKVWLHQCLPGPAPCSSLEGGFASPLECTMYAKECCKTHPITDEPCIPKSECYIHPIIGCIYAWYSSAGSRLEKVDIECGHAEPSTYNTVQLLLAKTNKVGCAYAYNKDKNARVLCNFSPSAPFIINTEFYCGLIKHNEVTDAYNKTGQRPTHPENLQANGINLKPIILAENTALNNDKFSRIYEENVLKAFRGTWGIQSLMKDYLHNWWAEALHRQYNGTEALIARLVTKYSFYEETNSKCDKNIPVYHTGKPGSACTEISRRYHALCYDYRDPTPGYRLIAVLAPVALFSLILYDLFSGVMRQINS